MDDDAMMPPAGKPLDRQVREECVGLDPYECEAAIQRLNEFLDHQLSEAERVVVVRHLEICRSCLKRFTFEQTLILSFRQKASKVCAPQILKEKLHILLRQDH